MAEFSAAYEVGRKNEGGYSNIKSDKGGETYSGVSRVYWPNWEGWPIIDAYKAEHELKRGDFIHNADLESLIKQFYYKNFWRKMSGDGIDSQEVATYIYDWSLTSGKALMKIQQMLGVAPDGSFGPVTVGKLNDLGGAALHKIYQLRVAYYNGIVAKSPDQQVNLAGWLNRANGLYDILT
mgnify:CR=1 FL=1